MASYVSLTNNCDWAFKNRIHLHIKFGLFSELQVTVNSNALMLYVTESFRICSKSFRGYGMCKSLTVANESTIF